MINFNQALRNGEWLEIPLSLLALPASGPKGKERTGASNRPRAGADKPQTGSHVLEPAIPEAGSYSQPVTGVPDAGSLRDEEAAPIGAGSHPHEVRQRLLALSLFPAKWVNRLFSVGGIRLEGDKVRLLAFPAADIAQDPLYRQAAEALGDAKRRQGPEGGAAFPNRPAKAAREGREGAVRPSGPDRAHGNGRGGGTGGDAGLKAAAVPNVPVLYEDDYCMVLDKPAGMPVHASFPGQKGTLDEAAALHCLLAGDPLPVRHVHRLDEDTSGPVLYSKNDLAQLQLDEQMREKCIDRRYIALVEGVPARKHGTVSAPIAKDRHHRSRRRVHAGGDEAVTHYEVLERFAAAALVGLRLETGRTHQIRVHMSHLGHPLLGDALYGGSTVLLGHQALHGQRLVFNHPLTGAGIEVESPIPDWFASVRALLKR